MKIGKKESGEKMRKVYLILILIGLASLYTAWKPGLINFGEKEAGADKLDEQKNTFVKIPTILEDSTILPQKKEPITILILGSDQRNEEAARSDSIMLTRYDPERNQMKVVSIMRDSYMNIPGYGYSKINHAYSWGGKDLMKETIEKNFGIKINHVALINFEGFTKLIDELIPEGIKVNVSPEMIKYFHWNMNPGEHNLHSQELLQYVRFRHDGNNDFGRVDRQQEVISKIKDKVMEKMQKGKGVSTMLSMIRSGKEVVETDISFPNMIEYGMNIMLHPIQDVQSLRIPVNKSFNDKMTDHAGLVLQYDEKLNKAALQQFLGTDSLADAK
ncbi:LytR family transcriptional attenuator [Falsibacillus pallidus]|uniref:Regulatory protein MsrR n=2 Tax=Falsibacillus pallidus TaxID=493781 RepID=A0A370GIR1_9BACI|nr:LytR family transcriptional attenuator [Falsibacillus pallidus]